MVITAMMATMPNRARPRFGGMLFAVEIRFGLGAMISSFAPSLASFISSGVLSVTLCKRLILFHA